MTSNCTTLRCKKAGTQAQTFLKLEVKYEMFTLTGVNGVTPSIFFCSAGFVNHNVELKLFVQFMQGDLFFKKLNLQNKDMI